MSLFSVVLELSLVKLLMISCFMKVTQHEIGVLYVLFKLHRQAQKVQLTRVTPDTDILGATIYKYLKEGEETLNRFVWILWPPDAKNTNSYFAPSIKWFTPAPLTQTPPPFGHLGETLNMLLQIHTTQKGEKSKHMWPLGLPEGLKKNPAQCSECEFLQCVLYSFNSGQT